MSWFSRNELADKVSALEQENDTLRADLQSAQTEAAKVPELCQEIAGLKEDNESLKSELDTAQTELSEARSELESAKSPESVVKAIESAVEDEESEACPIKEAVNKLVTNRIVAAGHPPLNTAQAEAEEQTAQKLSREAFRALPSSKRAEFVRNGGKITD
jgi:outer membrane murein-binding lipoprotein Lpp